MALLACTSAPNSGATASTSGSVKYVVGAPFGPKSRGGLVTVLGGLCGCAVCPVCTIATDSASDGPSDDPNSVPPATPSVLTTCRRDSINLVLDGRDRASHVATHRGLAIAENGVDEIFDQRKVNIRCRRMRFNPIAAV